MPLIGAHMSIAGGYHKAVLAAAELGMEVVQIFTKNNNQWQAKELQDEEAAQFADALKQTGISHPLAHDSYLINLASADEGLWRKSIDAFVIELRRAARLGVPHVVMHPGAYTTGSEQTGLGRVIDALDECHKQTSDLPVVTLLETTAGQGTCLGHRFEHLAAIMGGVKLPERLGVCVDTCHVFAAGYPLTLEDEYEATMAHLDRTVGLHSVKAFHLNDSKKPLGSRVDRHEHIGEGELGLLPFWRLLNDTRFAMVPMYLETPKETRGNEPTDAMNLRRLRELVGAPCPQEGRKESLATKSPVGAKAVTARKKSQR